MNGAHRANANMGIYSPKPSPPEINGHGVAVFYFLSFDTFPRDSYLCKYLYSIDRIRVLT